MHNQLFNKLHADGVISDSSLIKVKSVEDASILSVYWELKTMLYLGVLLFTGGAGILIFKNIDTIGHGFILLFIALVSCGSFIYCFKKSTPFSLEKRTSPSLYFDYVLLLACLTFTSLIAYLQFQYHFFGFKYGLALFIPMVILFVSAYYFDNLVLLSLAITSLGAWTGIALTPLQILHAHNFNNATIIFTGLVLGAFLVVLGFISATKNFKRHFDFTYSSFGAHLLFICCLAGMIQFDNFKFLWLLALVSISSLFYKKAVFQKSFYFLLILTLYLYTGVSYIIFQLLITSNSFDINLLALSFIYFIASAIALSIFLTKMNRKLKIL